MSKKVNEMTPQEYTHKRKHNAWYYKTVTRPNKKYIRKIVIEKQKIPRNIRAYIAGFIDGEGCICIRKVLRRCKTKNKYEIGINFSVYNTNKKSLELIKKYFDGCIYERQRGKDKKCYQFQFTSKLESLYNSCHQLKPFLIVKKPQAELLMEYCKRRIRASRKWGYKHFGDSYTERDWQITEECRRLNH